MPSHQPSYDQGAMQWRCMPADAADANGAVAAQGTKKTGMSTFWSVIISIVVFGLVLWLLWWLAKKLKAGKNGYGYSYGYGANSPSNQQNPRGASRNSRQLAVTRVTRESQQPADWSVSTTENTDYSGTAAPTTPGNSTTFANRRVRFADTMPTDTVGLQNRPTQQQQQPHQQLLWRNSEVTSRRSANGDWSWQDTSNGATPGAAAYAR